MLRITKYSIPVVLAGLVLTGRTEDTASTSAPQSSPGASGSSQQSSASRQQTEQQKKQQEQQKQALQQQENQQSIFQPGQVSDADLKKQVTEVNKASSFIGMAVKNTDNESIGKINDLVFDPEQGKISYAVISVGGILGVGDKLVAVPITSLKPQPGQKYLVLNMQKSQVESAPGLAQHNWPDLDAPGLGAAAGSESGKSSASGSSPASSSSSSSSPSSASPSSSSTSSSTKPASSSSSSSKDPSASSSKPQGSSPSNSSGSNSDSSQSKSSDTSSSSDSSKSSTSSDPSSSNASSSQGETKQPEK